MEQDIGSRLHYQQRLQELSTLCQKYNLKHQELDAYKGNLEQFHVATPMIGEFSTGKSSLINELLGKKYLGVNLTPETAVPVEISYGKHDEAVIIGKNGQKRMIPAEQLANAKLSSKETEKVELTVDNEFFQEIHHVKLVDMPGTNSVIALHNQAIDKYLPQSQAYLMTFSARNPRIPADMGNFLRELKNIHEIPVYILLTKCKSVTEKELQASIQGISADIKRCLGVEKPIGLTNAKGKERSVEALRQDLREIEAQSQQIFEQDVRNHLQLFGKDLLLYLETSLKKAELTPSEIEAEQEDAEKKLAQLEKKLANAAVEFNGQIDACVDRIRRRLHNTLLNAAPELENMLVNNLNVTDKLNLLVRECVLTALKEELVPRFSRYMNKVADLIHVDFQFNTNLQLSETQLQMDSMIKQSIQKTMPLILAAIGIALTGPIGAVIGAIGGLLLDFGFAKKQQNDRQRLARQKVEAEIIPQVENKAMETVNETVRERFAEINEHIEAEVQKQIEVQEKALADIKARYAQEQEKRQQELQVLQEDFEQAKKLVTDAN